MVVERALVLEPAGIGRFRPLLDGQPITKPTRQPLLDGARALLALGHDPAEVVTTRHAGSATIAMRSTIGEAARWTIEESDRGGLRKRIWMPHPSREVASISGAAREAGFPEPDALGEAA